jgi:hypothetical protein
MKHKTMDKQFNTLKQSYYDNYLQYKITGNPSYQNSYTAAEQGIQTILSELTSQINARQSDISNFYSKSTEDKLRQLQSDTKFAQQKVISEKDEVTASNMRQSSSSIAPPPSLKNYYIAVGSLGVIMVGLMMIR